MKTNYASKILFITMLVLTLGFKLKLNAQTNEIEPNNSIEQANQNVLETDSILGNFQGNQDYDYYYFELTEPGMVNIDLKDQNGKYIKLVYINIFRSTGKKIVQWDRLGNYLHPLYALNFKYPLYEAGKYYILIGKLKNSQTQNYSLKVTKPNDPLPKKTYEPNNSIAEAAGVILNRNKTISSNLLGLLDSEDFYKINLQEAGLLSVEVNDNYYPFYIELNLYKVDGTHVFETEKHSFSFTASPGEYIIQIKIKEISHTIPYTPYNLDLKFRPYDEDDSAETEPNNDFNTASPISLNGNLHGTLARFNGYQETDYYKLTVTDTGILDLLNDSEWLFPVITIYSEEGTQIKTSSPNDHHGLRLSTQLTPGTYYLKYSPSKGTKSSWWSLIYNTQVKFFTSTEIEPNNAKEEASMLNLDDSVKGVFETGYNVEPENDYYKVIISKRGTLKINVSNIAPKAGTSYLELYRANGELLEEFNLKNSNRIKLSHEITTPGAYFVNFKYKQPGNHRYNTRPYTIVATLEVEESDNHQTAELDLSDEKTITFRTDLNENVTLTLNPINDLGKQLLLFRGKVSANKPQQIQLPDNLKPGIYIVKLNGNKVSEYLKFIR